MVHQFVERRSAVACDTFEHFDAALSTAKNGCVRPAECVFEQLAIFHRAHALLPAAQINEIEAVKCSAVGIGQVRGGRDGGKRGRIDVDLEPVALRQESLGLIGPRLEAQAADIADPPRRAQQQPQQQGGLDREGRRAWAAA